MRALTLALLLAATPAAASDPVADLLADHLDCVSQRRDCCRDSRRCRAEQYEASLRPNHAPWLAWGLGVVGTAAAAGGLALAHDQRRRNIGIFVGSSGIILIVAGGYAAGW